jgi:hypothetical protein
MGKDGEPPRFHLSCEEVVYTQFRPALEKITTTRAGDMNEFIESLQRKLNDNGALFPPVAPSLQDVLAGDDEPLE